MELNCEFGEYLFNTGEKFYQCIIKQQKIPQDEKFVFIGQHLPEKSESDVTFVEFRDSNCPKVPHGLTKTFPNLKVLGFFNSKLKEISKDDLAEYKNLEKFICEKNEVDFLPGDLFEGFKNLDYIKFYGNKLGIIEPNFLDGLDKLDYVNFKSNPNLHTFYAKSPVYNPNAGSLGAVKNVIISNYINEDPQKIINYINKFPNPKEILNALKDRAIGVEAKVKMQELFFDFREEKRAKEIEELKSVEDKMNKKIHDLEASNAEIMENIQELKESESNLSQQVEQLRTDLDNEKEENQKLKRNLKKQIDNLTHQLQSVMSSNLKEE